MEFAEKFYGDNGYELLPWHKEVLKSLEKSQVLVFSSPRTGRNTFKDMMSEYQKLKGLEPDRIFYDEI